MKNNFYAILSSLIQNLFTSLFFVFIARSYKPVEFSSFLIANNTYQLFAAFSSFGLGQWFIREHLFSGKKDVLTVDFIQNQLVLGFLFYLISLIFSWLLYPDSFFVVSAIYGLNVIFDNIIYAVKHHNIAEFTQNKTFRLLIFDSFFRLSIGAVLLFLHISIISLVSLLVIIRCITVCLFLRSGLSFRLGFGVLKLPKSIFKSICHIILTNWYFAIIGALSIVYWKYGGILVSLVFGPVELASYEIAFKFFILFQVFPLAISASFFPKFSKLYVNKNISEFIELYNLLFTIFLIYGATSFLFIYCYGNYLLAVFFPNQFTSSAEALSVMFYTIIVFPTAFLQANVLISMRLEKIDMILNAISLFLFVLFSILSVVFFKDLNSILFSIFLSWLIFHLIQDFVLIRKGLITYRKLIIFLITLFIIFSGILFFDKIFPFSKFIIFWFSLVLGLIISYLELTSYFKFKFSSLRKMMVYVKTK